MGIVKHLKICYNNNRGKPQIIAEGLKTRGRDMTMTLRDLEKVMSCVYLTIIGIREEEEVWSGYHWMLPEEIKEKQVLAIEPEGNYGFVLTVLM